MTRSWTQLLVIMSTIFINTQAHAGRSAQLMPLAFQHYGHQQLDTHPFILSLKKGDFSREQAAQFFADRIHLLEIMETQTYPSWPDRILFTRSEIYRKELNKLMGSCITIAPSESAKTYGRDLEAASPEIVAVHLWTFLIGETYGTIHMAGYFEKKFSVGTELTTFGTLSTTEARKVYNTWLDELSMSESIDYTAEIGSAYDAFFKTFNAAAQAPPLSLGQSVLTLLPVKL